MTVSFEYRLRGKQHGPVSLDALRKLLEKGTVGPTDEARELPKGVWRPIGDIVSGKMAAPAKPVAAGEKSGGDGGRGEPVEWYYQLAGQELGPMPFSELLAMAAAGTMTADDQVRFGTEGKWRKVSSMGRLVAALPYTKRGPQFLDKAAARAADTALPANGASSSAPASSTRPEASAVKAANARPVPTNTAAPAAAPTQTAPAVPTVVRDPNWFAYVGGVEYGPCDLPTLRSWLQTGQLGLHDYVRNGVQGGWELVSSVVELVPPAVKPPEAAPVATPAPVVVPAPAVAPAPAKDTPAAKPASVVAASMSGAPAAIGAAPQSAGTKPIGKSANPAVAGKAAANRSDTPNEQRNVPAPAAAAAKPPANSNPTSPVRSVGAPSAVSPSPLTPSAPSTPFVPAASLPETAAVKRPVSKPKTASSGSWTNALSAGAGGATKVLLGMVAVGVLVAGWYFVWPLLGGGSGQDIVVYKRMAEVYSEYRKLRTSNAPDAEWVKFRDKVLPEFKTMATDLEKTSDSGYPARRYLLQNAKYRAKELFDPARAAMRDRVEQEFVSNLKEAAFFLKQEPVPTPPPAAPAGDQPKP